MEKKDQWMAKLKEIGAPKLLLLFIAGIVLVITSVPQKSGGNKSSISQNTMIQEEEGESLQQKRYREQMEEQLQRALTQVKGIGRTKVMITLKGSKEMVINKDTPFQEDTTKEKDSAGGEREQVSSNQQEETVLVTDESGRSIPYVIKELEPEISGILVIAEGGDREIVIQEITDACEVLFSVPVHKIKVMKMKDQE